MSNDAKTPLAALVEERVRLEDRLAEFHRIAMELGAMSLPASAVAAVQRLKAATQRFDAGLTALANVTHDLIGDAASGVRALMVIRVGDARFALPVEAVREVRSWRGRTPAKSWKEKDVQVVPVAAALSVPATSLEEDRRILVLETLGRGLLVDEITRHDELVVRPLGPLVPGPFLGAATISQDELILVLDPAALGA